MMAAVVARLQCESRQIEVRGTAESGRDQPEVEQAAQERRSIGVVTGSVEPGQPAQRGEGDLPWKYE